MKNILRSSVTLLTKKYVKAVTMSGLEYKYSRYGSCQDEKSKWKLHDREKERERESVCVRERERE